MAQYKDEDYFYFKGFKLANKNASFKINTDGVLLAAWSRSIESEHDILDIGTGTGVIAIIKAIQTPRAIIDAVEIDALSYHEASHNFRINELTERIQCYNCSIQNYKSKKAYNHIISNPPFYNTQYLPSDQRVARAKHNSSLSVEVLWDQIKRLSSKNCVVSLIYPIDEHPTHLKYSELNGFKINKICKVHGKTGGKAIRILSEFNNYFKNDLVEESSLTIRTEDGGFTNNYRALCQAYYL